MGVVVYEVQERSDGELQGQCMVMHWGPKILCLILRRAAFYNELAARNPLQLYRSLCCPELLQLGLYWAEIIRALAFPLITEVSEEPTCTLSTIIES